MTRCSTDAGFKLLAQAQAAARSGNGTAMIEALMASGFLDGLVRKLSFTYPDLDRADVDDVVAAAAGDAFEAIRQGRAITQLGGFISRAASNRANDKWENDYLPRRSAQDLPEGSTEDELDDCDRSRADDLADHRRDEAVRLARQLLPNVGQGQILDVMTMVIDAVAVRDTDFCPEVVANVLAISQGSARKLMSRGLERLRRAAVAAGIELPDEIPIHPDRNDATEASEESTDD
jgi:DNA-directed RNA polymerase specialized sigma24 family protein